MTTFQTDARGFDVVLNTLRTLRRDTSRQASRAVNTTATRFRTRGARLIRRQVAFPASYLTPGGGRLVVAKRANPKSLVATIRARSRPTSLARFARGATAGQRNVAVQVAPGRLVFLRRAFVIPLRRGTALTDTQRNLGIAIRLRPGERLINKRNSILTRAGLTLLYAPSVQQVFLDAQDTGVAVDISAPAARFLEGEYLRLLRL